MSFLLSGGLPGAFLQSLAVYYGSALLLDVGIPKFTKTRSVQLSRRPQGEKRRDALRALPSNFVKAIILYAAQLLHEHGYNKMYDGPIVGWRAWAYVALCLMALDFLHDTWFYWAHRLLHWRPLMRHVHYMHHQSMVPSAYTGYSFHWAEAAIVFANEITVTFLFPIHAGVHRAYHLFATLIHNGGHCGYEMAPFIPTLIGMMWMALSGGALHKGLNTVQHHDMHHRFPRRHFSLYFTHWDRWMGTMHPEYDSIAHGEAPQQQTKDVGTAVPPRDDSSPASSATAAAAAADARAAPAHASGKDVASPKSSGRATSPRTPRGRAASARKGDGAGTGAEARQSRSWGRGVAGLDGVGAGQGSDVGGGLLSPRRSARLATRVGG